MPRVAIPDRLFLAADSAETPQHITCLATFTPPDGASKDWLDTLERDLRAQRTAAAPFNFRLHDPARRAYAPRWDVVSNDEIDFDHHFQRMTLPAPGGQKELHELLSWLHTVPLDPSRPLWEFRLIDGLERGGIAIHFKVHHAIMDGVGGIGRLSEMITGDPHLMTPRAVWTVGPAVSDNSPSFRHRLGHAGSALFELAETVMGLGSYAWTVATGGRFGTEPDVPLPFAVQPTMLNRPISNEREVVTLTYDFNRIHGLAKAANCKINDIFLAMCSGGIRQYLAVTDNLPATSLTAAAPINTRDGDDQLTANAFTVFLVALATDIVDPIERLAAIARSGRAGKALLEKLPKKTSELYPAVYMGPLIGASIVGLGGRTTPPFSISTSNVPGPRAQQYLAGAKLEALYPMAMLYHGNGLFVGLLTNSGRVAISLVGDKKTVPHLDRLAEYFDAALVELEDAVDTDVQAVG